MSPLPATTEPLEKSSTSWTASRGWTWIGLGIALFGLPLNVGLFTALNVPWTAGTIALRELSIFAWVGALAFIIRRKELLGWESIGMQHCSPGKTALWVVITIPFVVL